VPRRPNRAFSERPSTTDSAFTTTPNSRDRAPVGRHARTPHNLVPVQFVHARGRCRSLMLITSRAANSVNRRERSANLGLWSTPFGRCPNRADMSVGGVTFPGATNYGPNPPSVRAPRKGDNRGRDPSITHGRHGESPARSRPTVIICRKVTTQKKAPPCPASQSCDLTERVAVHPTEYTPPPDRLLSPPSYTNPGLVRSNDRHGGGGGPAPERQSASTQAVRAKKVGGRRSP